MAPSTPPPPSSELFAALTIASTSSVVMSATQISSRVVATSAVSRGLTINGDGSAVLAGARFHNLTSWLRGLDPLLVKAALEHRIRLAHENMRRHLVLGAAELPQPRQQDQVIKRLGGQRQAQRLCLRAVLRPGHRI